MWKFFIDVKGLYSVASAELTFETTLNVVPRLDADTLVDVDFIITKGDISYTDKRTFVVPANPDFRLEASPYFTSALEDVRNLDT